MQRLLLFSLSIAILCVPNIAIAQDAAVPTLLAKRGKLMLDDHGDTDHSSRGLGDWTRSPDDPKAWRVTHEAGTSQLLPIGTSLNMKT